MKNLFDVTLVEETKLRIQHLRPESSREWGSMSVTQTLMHCTRSIEMAMGTIVPRRAPFPALILGPLIKPLVMRDDRPMRRNSPSAPELFSADSTEQAFEQERGRLIATLDSFVGQGAAGCTRGPHPFFGSLTPQEWSVLMYKHLDHHLRQFGA
ncbi:MAG TPA: DUF1569 domain-containing protein [Acidobacteriaceae bacterium]|nr:DUF1569 domain-containing protein [Acidobacteriaceae bacterium]